MVLPIWTITITFTRSIIITYIAVVQNTSVYVVLEISKFAHFHYHRLFGLSSKKEKKAKASFPFSDVFWGQLHKSCLGI